MDFTDPSSPTRDRYTDLAHASDGNYAFVWDSK